MTENQAGQDTSPNRAPGDPSDIIHQAIVAVAPDTDPGSIDPSEDLWYALDLDSMDQLNVMIAIGDRLGIEVPESDYPRLTTIEQLVDYVSRAES